MEQLQQFGQAWKRPGSGLVGHLSGKRNFLFSFFLSHSDLFLPTRCRWRLLVHLIILNNTHTHTQTHMVGLRCRARSEPGGTRWSTGGEVKGKLANGMGSQYSHANSERGVSSITKADAHTSAASSRLNWRPHCFGERRNLVSACVPSRSARAIQWVPFIAVLGTTAVTESHGR